MTYWYLGTPYSRYPDGIEAAFVVACQAAGILTALRIPVFSPIAHSHPIAMHSGMDPYDHTIWLPADEPFMAGACGLLVYMAESWETSHGIAEEVKYFERAGKPVIMWAPGQSPPIAAMERA